MHFGVLRKEGWPTDKEQKIMEEKNMKYVITRIRRFTKKAMKMISSWFNVKHS